MIYLNCELIYLASPYSHKDPAVVLHRFNEVCRWTAALLAQDVKVISPIAHSHPVSAASGGLLDPLDWATWQKLDFSILDRCDELWLCNMDGWRHSVGCEAEVKRAKREGKPCYLLTLKNGERLLEPVELKDFIPYPCP
jgi:Domain of unknown function (DUF1937)